MQIIKATEGLTKKEIYVMTRSPELQKMSDHVGDVIPVDKFVIYSDASEDGTETIVLSIMAADQGLAVATNSATARKEFEFILDLMEGDAFAVKVIRGKSKAGRDYITLALA